MRSFFLVWVIDPSPNSQPGGPVVFCGVFLPLPHSFRFAAVTQLPKHSGQGLRWRGRVTCDLSGRSCSLTVGITCHLWEHWWYLLTSPRPVTIALSLSTSKKISNEVSTAGPSVHANYKEELVHKIINLNHVIINFSTMSWSQWVIDYTICGIWTYYEGSVYPFLRQTY